jgi:hypothetical protein
MATDSQIPTPEPQAPNKRQRSAQDKKIQDMLGKAEQHIRAAQTEIDAAPLSTTGGPAPLPITTGTPTTGSSGSDSIADLLAEGGYTAAELTNGFTLYQAAQAAFAARQTADGALDAASAGFKAASNDAHKAYDKLRELAQSAFRRDKDARTTLGLSGPVSHDLQKFISAVRTFVQVGSANNGYTAKLTQRGVTAAKLQDLNAKIDALVVAAQAFADAGTATATADRDNKVQALTNWLSEYHSFVKAQFKDRPDIKGRLLI